MISLSIEVPTQSDHPRNAPGEHRRLHPLNGGVVRIPVTLRTAFEVQHERKSGSIARSCYAPPLQQRGEIDISQMQTLIAMGCNSEAHCDVLG
jgi:hypothetical protein